MTGARVGGARVGGGSVGGAARGAALLDVSPANLGDIAARGVLTPRYDRSGLAGRIAHIGVGGFHRAHLALYTHELAEHGSEWGIRGVGMLANDAAMDDTMRAQDGLYCLIEREDERAQVSVVGSIIDYVYAAGQPERIVACLSDPLVTVVSLTITEAGYAVDTAGGAPVDGTDHDDARARFGADTAFDLIATALDRRRRAGTAPVTILSCDNLPGNGDVARTATVTAARRRHHGLADWIEEHCTFPNSMVDRITPTTTDADRDWLAAEHGIADRWPVVTEPFRQWVVEDRFASGRPRWEDVGVVFTDDVRSWELYKLRLLNAAHSCMAYLCSLAGIVYVDEAIANPAVRHFLDGLLAVEAIPSLVPIPGHLPEEYVATVFHRFANSGVRDQIARLCIDGVSKFPTFLVPTIEHHLANGGPVSHAALALAGWARYLGTVPEADQATDASAGAARALAAEARSDPARFLELDAVITSVLRDNERFRTAFVDAYTAVAVSGPLAAMRGVVGEEPSPPVVA